MAAQNPKAGGDFVRLTIRIMKRTSELCTKTYAATLDDVSAVEIKKLIKASEAYLKKFDALMAEYTGGRREALADAGSDTVTLRGFVATLKNKLARKR